MCGTIRPLPQAWMQPSPYKNRVQMHRFLSLHKSCKPWNKIEAATLLANDRHSRLLIMYSSHIPDDKCVSDKKLKSNHHARRSPPEGIDGQAQDYGGDRSIIIMTVRLLNCIPKCTKTAFACFHVGFCLEINAGSISIYHAAYFLIINAISSIMSYVNFAVTKLVVIKIPYTYVLQ